MAYGCSNTNDNTMINITDNFRVNKPAPIDDRLGPFVSTASALSSIEIDRRHIGLTVIIDDGTGSVEYWFKDGVSNGDLEAKATGGGGGVPYTGATQDVDLGTHDLYTNKLWLFDEPNGNHASLHYTDGDFHIEHANGDKMFVIEDGFIQLHLTDTIQSNLFTSNLTQTRDHYLPDQSGTIAITTDITKEAVGLGNVDNTSDASKTFTAAQITSLVFDKARLPKVIPAVAIAGSAFTSGNTTSETIMSTLTIPANTLNVGDVVRISGLMTYTTSGTKSLRVKFGTTTSGTAIYSPANLASSATSTQFELFAVVTGSTTLRFSTNTVSNNTIYGNNTGALVSQTIDRTQTISFIVTMTKTNGADTVTCESAFLEIITS
jgi:hypothetical protein